ncbi:MAG TPA: glutamate synthase-related protein, partial [Trueperaceae bacterium]|nr:glutamate synthase-related protein [Trueperaceae bacterium]
GCAMIRQCHLNTCPVGIATQDPVLRAKFAGEPEHVVRFFLYLAQQVRMLLADIGVRSVAELVGRSDLLRPRTDEAALDLPHGVRLDLESLLAEARGRHASVGDGSAVGAARSSVQERNDRPGRSGGTVDDRLAEDAAVLLSAEWDRQPLRLAYDVTNRERSLGTRLAGDIARSVGDVGLPDGSLEVALTGVAGQSFGAFNLPGMRLVLTGEAQDYVGKSMAGGELVLRHKQADGAVKGHVIAGNTLLYGATGGAIFAAGSVGERVCVRNSGATAVVEGCGDHGCEYMTGGTVVVLGRTGRNFAAGMSGGVAYVLDVDGTFQRRLNDAMVTATRLGAAGTDSARAAGTDAARSADTELKALLEQHVAATGSVRASELLADWRVARAQFWRVEPKASGYPEPVEVGSQPYAATVPSSAAT